MHIECEKGSAPNSRTDRHRADRRSGRRGSSSTSSRQATRQDAATGDVTLEHAVIAAKRRRASMTAETAGYIALAVADVLAAAPAVVRPVQVSITEDGNVLLRGAAGRGDENAAEKSVRAMLATLLGVAAGASPALAAAARRVHPRGADALIHELEAALIPVNRAAARRAIGRLAREVDRANVQLPERNACPPSVPAVEPEPVVTESAERNAKLPAPALTEPAPNADSESVAPPLNDSTEPACTPGFLAGDDATEVDAPVLPIEAVAAEPVSVPEPSEAVTAPLANHCTPQLAKYDPCDAAAGVEIIEAAQQELEASDLEASDDLLTYEPPEALGDESLDFGTVSPPDVELAFPDDTVSLARPDALRAAEPTQAGADRVDELVAGFASSPERSSSDVAVEIKSMLGSAVTPPPPASGKDQAPESSRPKDSGGESSQPAQLPPIDYARPRHPKLALALTTALLLLAIAALIALYVLYPAVLVGH